MAASTVQQLTDAKQEPLRTSEHVSTESAPIDTLSTGQEEAQNGLPHLAVSVARRTAIPTFYINRESAVDRRASIARELRETGIAGERIAAVEGLAVPPEFEDYFFVRGRLHSRLNPGEVGCYASHLKALSVVVERGLPYALILEDDAALSCGLVQFIEDILANLPEDWDLVHLCRDPSFAVKPIARLKQSRMLVRYSRVPETTTGYLISPTGAEKFLRPLKRYWAIDTDIRQPWRFGLQVYGVTPRIVSPAGLKSCVHALGKHSRGRRGIPIPTRHCWTGNPLHVPQGLYFNLKTLGTLWWATCFLQNAYQRAIRALGLRALKRRLFSAPASAKSV